MSSTARHADGRTRCGWCPVGDELYVAYHDQEWGVPVHDDRTLFEMLILEGAQAGLSWRTVLNKRPHYREVYDGFDPAKVARFDEARNQELLQDAGIIRNRLKVTAAVDNARAFLEMQEEFGSFDVWLWDQVDGQPIKNHFKTMSELPAKTALSDRMAKELKKRGFRFVGSTILYAYLQSVGVVDDHLTHCFRY